MRVADILRILTYIHTYIHKFRNVEGLLPVCLRRECVGLCARQNVDVSCHMYSLLAMCVKICTF